MKIVSRRIRKATRGAGDLVDITGDVAGIVAESGSLIGQVTLFVIGSTAGITTFEYEPGLVKDIQEFFESLAPSGKHFHHDDTWGDANGFSHIRATFTGPSLTIPFENGRLLLGTWQQIVLAEFDNRGRNREVVVHVTGEQAS